MRLSPGKPVHDLGYGIRNPRARSLRRDAYATFSVWGKKCGENPVTGPRRWFDRGTVKALKSPIAIKKAIEDEAKFLGVIVEWVDAISLIASIDWLTAAVIASNVGYEIPALPDVGVMLSQRSLRAIGRVTISAEWGYDMHQLGATSGNGSQRTLSRRHWP